MVAGRPETKHSVPSGRAGWSKGLHSVLAATLVATVADSVLPLRPSSRDMVCRHKKQHAYGYKIIRR